MRKVLLLLLLSMVISLGAKAESEGEKVNYDPTECGCTNVRVFAQSGYKNHITFFLQNNNDFKVKAVVAVYYCVGTKPTGGCIYEKVSNDVSYVIPAHFTQDQNNRIDHWAGKLVNNVSELGVEVFLEHCYEVR